MRRSLLPVLLVLTLGILFASPRAVGQTAGTKRLIFGGSCPTCPWGVMGDALKEALQPYGYDLLVCYSCGGPARSVRLVADGAEATPPQNPAPGAPPTPVGKIDLGATGAELLRYAYLGLHDFAKDKEGPRKNLRLIANIQMPTYYMIAVDAKSNITDLRQIVERKLPVKIVARGGFEEGINAAVLAYYGLTPERVSSFGGTLASSYVRGAAVDVVIGWAALVNAPEYAVWYDAPQQHDLIYLDMPAELRARLAKDFFVEEHAAPQGLLRGVDRRIPTVARNGTVVYARADLADNVAHDVARALDERKTVLQWSIMPFSYDAKTVGSLGPVPLHPGAEKYYRGKGYR